ncbi:MAG TPA: SpoIIE family protein phosphatase [Leptospiraceae bacterium]|nr:SpoIIE family protein phosphatase [Leptospirales bacterium]HMW58143.1 SpoIIE family protein phosphatase [Leptospiraceae bacterium]HMY45764.1 SpoIIE family protein phosphatase [Leptospiraceae bacterium]HMZ38242.1 SpoIIE family protein phosphatase [Leptospiraceae bacterium]HNJ03065.1 SpoIIE family protein phosphatase [Leptospiraceae bacterium]
MKQVIPRLGGSLRLEIFIIYAVLAVSTIVFFSTIILENQSDLLLDLFRYQSRDVTQELGQALRKEKFDAAKPESLTQELAKRQITSYYVINATGECLFPAKCTTPPGATDTIRTLISEAALFKTDSHISLDPDSGTASFVLSLDDSQRLFLQGSLKVSAMEARMSQVNRQLWLVLGWMVVFNVAFGIYVYRRIFSRVDKLKLASEKMATGSLDARVNWKWRKDELDLLGRSFNAMAETIETQMKQISRLNLEMNEEMRIGREVQQVFLMQQEEITSRGIAMYFQPLRQVSGDVYFFQTINYKDRTYEVFFLADATGHGVPAALITSILLLSLREALASTLHPGKVLMKLNDLMYERLQSQYYATGCIFLRDDQGRLHYASGGHPSPLWFRPSTGQILELEATGPMLGMIDGVDFEGRSMPVQKGDRILIYSDGVTEGARDHEMFGLDRLKQVVLASNNPDHLVQSVWENLNSFVDHHVDDVTIFSFEI